MSQRKRIPRSRSQKHGKARHKGTATKKLGKARAKLRKFGKDRKERHASNTAHEGLRSICRSRPHS